ncbi:hypothetical protein [Octadecabacter arcticus]|uniref:hypothetical protein n=1 Tax=Octadecabacter arcticus TaxID=53946 RepID=UPI0005C43A60|nr:hypothetical protein [Octadecabacter arcticus]
MASEFPLALLKAPLTQWSKNASVTPEALKWTDWFLTLPLWLELDGFRLVHACWVDDAIATVAKRRPDGPLRVEDLLEVSEKKTKFAKAVERLTSGP